MPLHAMMRGCVITSSSKVMYNDKNIGLTEAYNLEGNLKPYPLYKQIHYRNQGRLVGNPRGCAVAYNKYKLHTLMKQKVKADKVVEFMPITDTVLKARELYRSFVIKLLTKITNTPYTTAVKNFLTYAIKHKGSSFVQKYRWGTLTHDDILMIIPALKNMANELIPIINKLSLNETIVIDERIGFEGIRMKSDLTATTDHSFTELLAFSRDVVSLGPFSHLWAILDHDFIREQEKTIIEGIANIYGLKVRSPFINNSDLWSWLKGRTGMYSADGSNWQYAVANILGSPISTIDLGWLLLASGASTTSIEGICAMIVVLGEQAKANEIGSFGDDLVTDEEVLIPGIIEPGVPNTFLGINYLMSRVDGVKICRDDATKQLNKPGTPDLLSGYDYGTNIPDLDQKMGSLIAYGFCPIINIVDMNIDSSIYLKEDQISVTLRNTNAKKWDEVMNWYNVDGYRFFLAI